MAWLALLMMLLLLSTLLQKNILIGFFRGKNLRGLIQHMVLIHVQSQFTGSQPPLIQQMLFFDKVVAHLRVRSEHCMGALKGRFQCLRGLRLNINTKREHNMACRWITIAIILHNIIIDVEGQEFGAYYSPEHGGDKELDDQGPNDEPAEGDSDAKRRELVAELMAFWEM
jgi:hypothetical protein